MTVEGRLDSAERKPKNYRLALVPRNHMSDKTWQFYENLAEVIFRAIFLREHPPR
jgi:hypothetical protein